MKNLIFALAIILTATTAQAMDGNFTNLKVGNQALICGDPYVDLRCKPTITQSDTYAQSLGKSLVCASTLTLTSAVTVTSPMVYQKGCMISCGTGTLTHVVQSTYIGDSQYYDSTCTAGKKYLLLNLRFFDSVHKQ